MDKFSGKRVESRQVAFGFVLSAHVGREDEQSNALSSSQRTEGRGLASTKTHRGRDLASPRAHRGRDLALRETRPATLHSVSPPQRTEGSGLASPKTQRDPRGYSA